MIDPRINPRLLVDAAFLRWRLMAIALIACVCVAVAASFVYKRPYTASATLLVESNTTVSPVLSEMTMQLEVQNRIPVIGTVLRSRNTAERMLRALGEVDENTPDIELDWAVILFQERIDVWGGPGGMVYIHFRGSTREQCLYGLQLLIEIFLDEMLRPQRESLDASVEFLAEQLDRVRAEMEDQQSSISEFQSGSADYRPEVFAINLDLLRSTQTSVLQARAELAAAEQEAESAMLQLLAFDPAARELDRDIRTAQSNVDDLRSTYSDDHPLVRDARARLSELEAQRRAMVTPEQPELTMEEFEAMIRRGDIGRQGDVVAQELTAYRAATRRVDSLRDQITQYDQELREIGQRLASHAESEQRLAQLERELEVQSSQYSQLLDRYQDALVTRELTLQEEARQIMVIESPSVPPGSNRVALPIAAAAGAFAGLFLAIGVMLVAEFFDASIRTAEEAAQAAGLPVIGIVPKLERS